MTEVFTRSNVVSHDLFQFLYIRKTFFSFRNQIISSSTRISKIPPVPGTSATSLSSDSKVVKSSCAIQAARISQRHCVQYLISTRLLFVISQLIQVLYYQTLNAHN